MFRNIFLESILDSIATFEWGKIVLYATIFALVVAIILTCRYVNRKYLSDEPEKPQKKKKKGKK